MERGRPLYFRLVGARLRSAMQYRASFVAEVVGNFTVTALDFVALVILMTRFHKIGDWNLGEVAFLYGTSSISFSLAELFSGAFHTFDRLVVRGEFDRMLIRPLTTEYQMFTGDFQVRRLGRITQGILALAYALYLARPIWHAGQYLFFGVMIAGGTLFFLAVFIFGATAAFWTPQTGELTNIFTYGGQFVTSFPMNIYRNWLRSIFTFVIPMAFVNFYPTLYLLSKPDPMGLPSWVPFLAPFVSLAVFLVALAIWRVGVRHYQSTGS